jgi:hypothetical protein
MPDGLFVQAPKFSPDLRRYGRIRTQLSGPRRERSAQMLHKWISSWSWAGALGLAKRFVLPLVIVTAWINQKTPAQHKQ